MLVASFKYRSTDACIDLMPGNPRYLWKIQKDAIYLAAEANKTKNDFTHKLCFPRWLGGNFGKHPSIYVLPLFWGCVVGSFPPTLSWVCPWTFSRCCNHFNWVLLTRGALNLLCQKLLVNKVAQPSSSYSPVDAMQWYQNALHGCLYRH